MGAWIYVAAGAALIAVAETWGLREAYGWSDWTWGAIVVAMLLVCGATTKIRRHRRHRHEALGRAADDRATAEGRAAEERAAEGRSAAADRSALD